MTPARRRAFALLAVATVAIAGPITPSNAESGPAYPMVLVFVLHGASLEELAARLGPLGSVGGAALLAHGDELASTLDRVTHDVEALEANGTGGGVRVVIRDLGTPPASSAYRSVFLDRALAEVIKRVEGALRDRRPVQAYVASDGPSPADASRGDTLGGVVAAFLPSSGSADGQLNRTLTSDSTHRAGVVIAEDLEFTIVSRAGLPTGLTAGGAEIRIVDAPPPFGLHERYVAMRRMSVPVQAAAGSYVTIGGLFALAVLLRARRRPVAPWLGWLACGISISVPVLASALLAAGHLPTLSYATVVPFVVAVTAGGTAAALALARRDVLLAPLAIAVAVLAFFVAEAILGWTAALTPFLGGSQLDGARFYGLPNAFIGLLLGASLWTASRLTPTVGFVVIVVAALLAGMPFAGADLGGAVTLFAAAGLWLPRRARGRFGWREGGFALAVVAAGTAATILAHRFLATTPTHVTGLEAADGIGALWSTLVRRLGIGWDLIERNPFAIVPVMGVLVTLAVVLRPPAAVADPLERRPAWRDALLVILLASVVAYVANDTGPAALGLGFGLGLGGLLYVSCADRTWKMRAA